MPEEEGAPCLLCLATASGLPLFCRPPRPQVPFSLVGALHGVHLFGAAAGVELREAATPTAHLAWAGYGNSITLIVLSPAPGPPGPALARILDSAFGAMVRLPPSMDQYGPVLVLGLDELVPVRNVERLKRDLRSCFGLIDALLKPKGGWGMGPPCCPLPPATPRDALQVPHRLLLLGLVPGVGVALLCGPRPSLQHLLTQHLLTQHLLTQHLLTQHLLTQHLLTQHLLTQVSPWRGFGGIWGDFGGSLSPNDPPWTPPCSTCSHRYLLIRQGHTQSGIVRGAGQAGALSPQRRADALRHLYTLVAPQYCPELGGKGPPPGARLCYMALPTHTGCCLLRPDLLLLLLLPPGTPRDPLHPTALSALSALGHG
ncbi:protein fuzzy homolog [Sylvia borin]